MVETAGGRKLKIWHGYGKCLSLFQWILVWFVWVLILWNVPLCTRTEHGVDFFTKLQQATAQGSHCTHTHTRKWNNKTCFPGKTRATMSSRMQGSLLKCRGVRDWGGAHFVWLAGETPAPMHTRNADSWTGKPAPPPKQGWPARRGWGRLSVPKMHSQVRCCWVGRYPGQAASGKGAMGGPWGARQGLGIPVEAQPPVSFSGPLILYPCHSPVLAQKIWTVPNGAEKI